MNKKQFIVYHSEFIVKSNTPSFRRSATVVRNRRNIADCHHSDSRVMDRSDCRFATATGTFDANFALRHSGFQRFAGGFRSGLLRGKRSAFARASESARARRRLRDQIAFHIGNRNQRVVKRRRNHHDSRRNIFSLFFAESLFLSRSFSCCFCHF